MVPEKVPRTFPASLAVPQGHKLLQSLGWAVLLSDLFLTLSYPGEATEGRVREIRLYRQVPDFRNLTWFKVTGGRLPGRVLKTHLLL